MEEAICGYLGGYLVNTTEKAEDLLLCRLAGQTPVPTLPGSTLEKPFHPHLPKAGQHTGLAVHKSNPPRFALLGLRLLLVLMCCCISFLLMIAMQAMTTKPAMVAGPPPPPQDAMIQYYSPSYGTPDEQAVTSDWLSGDSPATHQITSDPAVMDGTTGGRFEHTFATDTYGLKSVQVIFSPMLGLAFVLVTPTLILIGYQMMLAASSFRHAGPVHPITAAAGLMIPEKVSDF